MPRYCKFSRLTDEGNEETEGWVILEDDGTLHAKAMPGPRVSKNKRSMRVVMRTDALVDGRWVSKEENPKLWFEHLPEEFSGFYAHCNIVETLS